MLSDARRRPSFLTAPLIFCIASCNHVLADTFVVDDQDGTPDVLWDGIWEEFIDLRPAHAWQGTLTRANTTGPTVTFTFTGTSVQVFGALRPVGTWDMRSLYSIDGGRPNAFVPSREVDEDAYGQQFFDSGTLPLDKHTLKITNLGDQLWLDYFLYDDGNGHVASSTDRTAQAGGTKTVTTTVTRARHSSSLSTALVTPSLPSSITEVGTGGSILSTSSEITTFSQPSPALSVPTSSSLVSTAVLSVSLTPPRSSPLPPSSPFTSSLNASVPSQAAADPPGEQHAHGVSRTALVALAAASATISAIALLAILYFTPPSPVPDVAHPAPESARAGEGAATCSCCRWLRGSARRSMDGGVRIAGGPPGMSHADAPSLSDAESEKSTLPPSYKDFDHDDAPELTDGRVVP
ncbi:hypothetical protein V8D89_000916 [Ganoderma adspersum]